MHVIFNLGERIWGEEVL